MVLNLAGSCESGHADTGCAEDGSSTPIFPVEICTQSTQASGSATTLEQLVACSEGPTRVMAAHAPVYCPVPHTSKITAQATNTTGGIEKITIYAIKGTMTDCTELGDEPSVFPCRKDATNLPDHECLFEDPLNPEECILNIQIDDGDMISYHAVATPVSGPELSSSQITYSGGQPAVEVAVPVWWHTNLSNAPHHVGRIKLALYMDPDFDGNVSEFGNYLSTIVRRSFINGTREFSEKFRRNRHFFDIWAFPFAGATAKSTCDHVFTGGAADLYGKVNGSAVLHKTSFTDCSTIGEGVAGSVDVGKSKSDWILVHESGHFLFGLADEYGKGDQVTKSEPPNVFSTESECNDAAESFDGAATPECIEFGTGVQPYRIQTVEPETMKQEHYGSEFRNSADAVFSNIISKCAGGQCYESQ